MADTSNLTNYLTDVADSIREKTHSNELIPASKFDEKILSIATDTTANPTEILSGKTAYINGDKVTGTYPIQYKKLDDITSTNTTLDTPIEAYMKLLPVGNTTQEVISAVAGTTVSGTDLTITDYDSTKESKFTKFSGNTTQATSILPEEYQQVEYIESTGTQYIDTGIKPKITNNIKPYIKIKCSINDVSQQQRIFGASIGQKYFQFYNLSETLGIQLFQTNQFTIFTKDTNVHTYIFNTEEEIAYQDNTSYELLFDSYELNINLFLFARNTEGQATIYMIGKIYNFAYDDGLQKINLIPCYRKSDNEIGMYDLVNGVFYTNQGTGTFLKGSDVSIPNPSYPQDIQVVKGSNNVKVGNKNLCKINGYNQASTMNGLTISYSNNKLLINGTCTARTDLYVTWFNSDFALLKDYINKNPDTYYGYTNKNNVRVTFYNDSNYRGGYTENSIPVSANVIYGTFFILIPKDTVFNNEYLDVIIEKGQKTSYVAHQEQNYPITLPTGMELCKIGDYQDYIYKNGDNWYKKSYIGKFNINSIANYFVSITEHMVNLNNTNGIMCYKLPKSNFDALNINSENFNGYCNMFKYVSEMYWNSTAFVNCFGNMSGLSIYFIYSDIGLSNWIGDSSDNTTVRNALKAKNMDFYLLLKTPTDTQITDTTLIGQLEAIEEATGYAGTMYITSSNSGNDLAIVPTYHYNYVTPAPSPERESDIQVVKGSNNIKVQNKNYLDISKCVMGANNTTVDTTITYSTKTNRACTKFDVNPIYVKPSATYIIKIDSNYNFSVAQLNSRNRVLSDSGWKSANFSFTASANCQKITMNFKKSNDANFTIEEFKTAEFQVEEGSMTTPYIEHQEQNYPITLPEGMELCKIGDYSDVIFKNEVGNPLYDSSLVENSWYKKGAIGKLVLAGQSFAGFVNNDLIHMYTQYNSMFGQKLISGTFTKAICNREIVQYNNYSAPIGTLYVSSNGEDMTIKNSSLTTKEQWQQYFQDNPHIIYGVLSTPTYTQITDTTLVGQLNAIYNNAKTYYDKTNIIITAGQDNATMQLKVKIPVQGIDTSEVTATSDDIILGKTAVINNQVVIGTSVAVVVSDTTALASDVAYGKVFYLADGTKAVGTYVPEDLNTELTALENQTTALQTALENKTSTEITQSEYEEAVEQVEDLLGDSNE